MQVGTPISPRPRQGWLGNEIHNGGGTGRPWTLHSSNCHYAGKRFNAALYATNNAALRIDWGVG
jgi:hypothetical protein